MAFKVKCCSGFTCILSLSNMWGREKEKKTMGVTAGQAVEQETPNWCPKPLVTSARNNRPVSLKAAWYYSDLVGPTEPLMAKNPLSYWCITQYCIGLRWQCFYQGLQDPAFVQQGSTAQREHSCYWSTHLLAGRDICVVTYHQSKTPPRLLCQLGNNDKFGSS